MAISFLTRLLLKRARNKSPGSAWDLKHIKKIKEKNKIAREKLNNLKK
jgi:hypothetical protein